jgi:predicted O-methyltransferase YrrM
MRIGVVPESLAERIALSLGLVPTPLVYTMSGPVLSRLIVVATKSGVFEALAPGPSTLERIATRCDTHVSATQKLLDALTSAGFLRAKRGQYRLAPVAQKWLLAGSRCSLHDMVLFSTVAAEHLEYMEEFLRSGKPLNIHEAAKDSEMWPLYQRGMRSLAFLSMDEVARRTFVPEGARDMLDIGGSHGLYSVAICQRHPGLSSIILDLPEAVEHAAPLLVQEGMGERVLHRAGNAMTDDLGSEAYDVVFVSQLTHHFAEATNRDLVQRAAGALRPGGALVIQEVVRRGSATNGGQVGGLLDLCFALTSESGTWSFEEIASWQREAGLLPRKPLRLRNLPGGGQQVAVKPS